MTRSLWPVQARRCQAAKRSWRDNIHSWWAAQDAATVSADVAAPRTAMGGRECRGSPPSCYAHKKPSPLLRTPYMRFASLLNSACLPCPGYQRDLRRCYGPYPAACSRLRLLQDGSHPLLCSPLGSVSSTSKLPSSFPSADLPSPPSASPHSPIRLCLDSCIA